MEDLREKLRIKDESLRKINEFLLDRRNPLVNDLFEIIEKYGGVSEINRKAREAGVYGPQYLKRVKKPGSRTLREYLVAFSAEKLVDRPARKRYSQKEGQNAESPEPLHERAPE